MGQITVLIASSERVNEAVELVHGVSDRSHLIVGQDW